MFSKQRKHSSGDGNKTSHALGHLSVPPDAEVNYVEPGILYKPKFSLVNKEIKIYSDLDMKKILTDESDQSPIIFKKDEANDNNKKFQKDKVIARPFEYIDKDGNKKIHPDMMEVVLFKWTGNVNPDLPESGSGITEVCKGYMRKKDLEPVDSYRCTKDHIFTQLPQRRDIIQGQIKRTSLESVQSIDSLLKHYEANRHDQNSPNLKK